MRPNSQNLVSTLLEDNLGVAALVNLDWNQNYYFTDLGRDVTVGGQVYQSSHPLVSIDPLRYNSVVNRELFNFKLSALDADMIAEIAAGITHRPVQISLMFLVTDVAQTDPAELLPLYRGYVSKVEEMINQDEKIFNIECTAPLSDLDAIGTLYTTKSGMEVYSATDTSFDTVNENSQAISLKWGKI
jgi:hypothetical protein